jgi:two-component system, NtrC family, sensor kinase
MSTVSHIDAETAAMAGRMDFVQDSLLFDRAPVPMWLFDTESLAFLAVNQAAIRKYGYSREEFLALTIEDIRPATEIPRLRRDGLKSLDKVEAATSGEWKHRTKAGEVFDVEITSSAVRFAGRDAELVAAYDLTAHTRERRGMAVRYALTRMLAESSGDVTSKALRALCEWFDFDLVEFWRPYAGNQMLLRKMFWQPPDDPALATVPSPVLLESRDGALAQTWISGWPAWIEDLANEPGYRERLSELRKAGLSNGIAFAVRAQSATLAVVVLLSRKQGQQDTQKIELMRDIGVQLGQHMERCRAEQESNRSADAFRSLFDGAPLPYHEIDRNGLIVRVNRAECELLGVSAKEMIGRPVWDFISPAERDESRESVRRKFAEGRVRPPYERKYRAPNGLERIFQIHERLITSPGGEVTGIRTAMIDMTPAHESQRQIQFQASLLEQVGDAIVTLDPDYNVTSLNRAAERLFGLTAAEAIGKNYQTLTTVELSAEEALAIGTAIATHSFWRGENTIVKSNGERLVLDVSDSALRGPHGELQGVVAIIRDITQRKRAEEALRATEDRLTLALSAISIGSWEADLKGTGTTKGSPQLLRLLGFPESQGEYTHEEWVNRIHPDDRDRVSAEAAANNQGAGSPDRQFRVVWPDGSVHWLHSKHRLLLDSNGQPDKLIGVDFDITEHKAAEERLRILSDAVEQSPVSIVITDLQGNIEYVNHKATEVTGYTFEELIGKNSRILKSGHTSEQEYANLWATIPTQEWSGTFQNRRKNGELFWEAARIRPIRDASGAATHFLAVKEDITEQRAMEVALAQAQKLESIGQLAAGIAHEINTPIQYVGDNAKFLDDAFRDLVRFVEPHRQLAATLRQSDHAETVGAMEQSVADVDVEYLSAEIPKAIEQMLEGVAHVAKIVRAMKEFSHPGPVEKVPVNINRAIESTVVVSKNEWKYVAELTTDLDPELPPVPCLVTEFNQVILNLIVNAAHAIGDVVRDSGKKGAIRISTRQDGDWVEVRVGDTGTGIPEEVRSRIFTPFFTTKEVGKGTGQGLAISHAVIVKKHQGSIQFECAPAGGTTFVIRLPLESGEEVL